MQSFTAAAWLLTSLPEGRAQGPLRMRDVSVEVPGVPGMQAVHLQYSISSALHTPWVKS